MSGDQNKKPEPEGDAPAAPPVDKASAIAALRLLISGQETVIATHEATIKAEQTALTGAKNVLRQYQTALAPLLGTGVEKLAHSVRETLGLNEPK